MSAITTHILDTALGKPASGVAVSLLFWAGSKFKKLATGTTNEDGRIMDLLDADQLLQPGTYQLIFEIGAYFMASDRRSFYPQARVDFSIDDADQHYHVPLLVAPFSYSTYRGS